MDSALPGLRPTRSRVLIESEVVAMVIFVFTEVMLFAGFLSAYTIIGSGAPVWPPVGEPELPVGPTAVASLALILSGGAVMMSGRGATTRWLGVALGLAGVFVVWQVVEAVRLVQAGLTMVSSAHGGFFYTIVGAHAIHALVAMIVLSGCLWRQTRGGLSPGLFKAVRIFWYFVVGLWPVLYAAVYL